MKNSAECPVCGAEIICVEGTVIGELISCPECGADLEVLNIDPFELAEAPQEEEDWGE
jgi:alpha-aminoadipate carrier protein LysW